MEQIDSFGSRAARAAKVALLSLSLSDFSSRKREFFYWKHGRVLEILFVQRDKFCKYLIGCRVEMLSGEKLREEDRVSNEFCILYHKFVILIRLDGWLEINEERN